MRFPALALAATLSARHPRCGAPAAPIPDRGDESPSAPRADLPPRGGDSPLARARALAAPEPSAVAGGEFEHRAFWEENGDLLRAAWDELDRTGGADDGTPPPARNASPSDLIEPRLAGAASAARDRPTPEAERAAASLWSAAVPSAPGLGVYRARLLTEDGLRRVRSHLDRAASSGVPARRPNAMNRYGLILDGDVDGACSLAPLERFASALAEEVVRPIGRTLFPTDVGRGDDAEHYAFTIRYGEGEDAALSEHRDASIVTLNVNLNLPGEGYGGSSLYFVDPADKSVRHTVEFSPGMAIIHRGALRHAALPIESGVRQNLVIWLFGKGGDVRIAPYAPHEQLTFAERWGEGEALPWWKEVL